MRTKTPRRQRSCRTRRDRPAAVRMNANWSMDFMADELFDGRRFRVLTIVDDFTRERPAIEVGQRLTGQDVVKVLTRIGSERGCPGGSEWKVSFWLVPKLGQGHLRGRNPRHMLALKAFG